VKIIPGHGEDCTMEDFRSFQSMLVKTTDIVRRQLADGKDPDTLKAQDVLKDWTSFECSYVDRNQWIDYLVNGLEGKTEAEKARKKLFEPLYYAWKEKGAEAAVARYHELRATQSDLYPFDEITPMYIGYKLFKTGKFDASLKFFELAVAEFPRGQYAYLCYYYLGRLHYQAGKKDLAAQNYRKSLELNPDNPKAAERLKELEQQ
jgi:TolA-binding protein